MISQIYVDYIVFGGMSNAMVKNFVKKMQFEFEMSLGGELTHFLGQKIPFFLVKASMQIIL